MASLVLNNWAQSAKSLEEYIHFQETGKVLSKLFVPLEQLSELREKALLPTGKQIISF